MVTGAAGSIGSELCVRSPVPPAALIGFDEAETHSSLGQGDGRNFPIWSFIRRLVISPGPTRCSG